jgi:ATPase subunit of ABC transporter with duplicated ATPase domains
MGFKKLYDVKKEFDAICAGEIEDDGTRMGELSTELEEMNAWTAESDAAELLSNLGVAEELHERQMKELNTNQKVRVLLAQALFGNPDVLILDEPTNDLDTETILWLEDFMADFKNTIIVVSHDRHFLDAVCTHVADVDRQKISLYTGNYTFWYESSQLAARQMADKTKKMETKRQELMAFIQRFSANASKAKQATSRKKALEKLNVDEIQPSTRRYPGIVFKQCREVGDQILTVSNLRKSVGGELLFDKVSFTVEKGDKIALLSKNSLAVTKFLEILAGENNNVADAGSFEWGVTIKNSYLPNENSRYFTEDDNLIDWLRRYSAEKDETFIRGFLGRMLFSGEETLKKSNVLSGGEKVRCLISKLMLEEGNVMLLDEPTSHLDLEAITKFNNALIDYPGVLLFTSHDHQFVQTIANRIIELTPNGIIDKLMPYDDYLRDKEIKALRQTLYAENATV